MRLYLVTHQTMLPSPEKANIRSYESPEYATSHHIASISSKDNDVASIELTEEHDSTSHE